MALTAARQVFTEKILGTEMNVLDFGVKRSKFKVKVASEYLYRLLCKHISLRINKPQTVLLNCYFTHFIHFNGKLHVFPILTVSDLERP